MPDDTWHAARLIPTSGITGPDEQERRVVSALLAVMGSVREFGRVITQAIGGPAGQISTFIEVPFKLNDQEYRPDGLIRVRRGNTAWTCLVEVKTSRNCLDAPQIEAYLDVAREQGFNAVLTISNELPAVPGTHPTAVDGRKTKKVALHHLSWTEIHSLAVVQEAHHGVADPDQAWILSELIRYLEHPRSGAMEFHDMGPSWVPCRQSVAAGTLRSSDKDAVAVAARWDQLARYLCLRLGRQIGREVEPVFSRKGGADAVARAHEVAENLCAQGSMAATILVPNTVGKVKLETDLRTNKIGASVEMAAPREGRPQTRISWLLKQLKNAPDDTRIDAIAFRERGAGTSALLKDLRDNPQLLVADPRHELKTFRVSMSRSMNTKRGENGFVESMGCLVEDFYANILQGLRPYVATAPKLRGEAPNARSPLTSASPSSQDRREADVLAGS